MNKVRLSIFILLLLCGIGLIIILIHTQSRSPLGTSLAPVYQLLGKPVKLVDRAFTRMMPLDSLDEKKYGEMILERYPGVSAGVEQEQAYVQELMDHLATFKKKDFPYRVIIIRDPYPNAFALPGGIIWVTLDLLQTLESESELVAILAHEMGHIERSHCLDAVRFQLLARKTGLKNIGEMVDQLVNILLYYSFSKTQEDEADEYAYQLLLNTPYDPCGLRNSFVRFLHYEAAYGNKHEKAHILRDYFMSHPPLSLRERVYFEKAKMWWQEHPEERRFIGHQNLRNFISFYQNNNHFAEWKTNNTQ